MLPRVSVDFNTMMMDEEERVYVGRIDGLPAEQDLLRRLAGESRVILYDEELEVEATLELVQFREDYIAWMGRPDWSTRRDLTVANIAPHFSPIVRSPDGGSDA